MKYYNVYVISIVVLGEYTLTKSVVARVNIMTTN